MHSEILYLNLNHLTKNSLLIFTLYVSLFFDATTINEVRENLIQCRFYDQVFHEKSFDFCDSEMKLLQFVESLKTHPMKSKVGTVIYRLGILVYNQKNVRSSVISGKMPETILSFAYYCTFIPSKQIFQSYQ